MKSVLMGAILVFCLTSHLFTQNNEMASAQELQHWINSDKESNRAKVGEHVYIVIVKVKDQVKDEFEAWVDQVLYAALNKSKSTMKQAQLKATRWLEPIRKREDDTWYYCWIMDPGIPKTQYDILAFLQSEYGEEQGQQHYDKYQSLVEETPYGFRQTDR